ncbi:MAG: glycosyltransferase family 2 protein [Phascolarctobacterium sp.]|uniref:glycosyltransferase family 2 protein n=1 Tax=Phascolarctobacterium sp. TaxID=2049039 RepID=UPI0026DBD870|nr:glycosyltransferase family 2 protein [Phascolarctobacterium sp.]MDO4920663.1 glycosyltransferase family 2 protein [Phascolarctobacterium sp.]
MKKITLLVPCYNEEAVVGKFYDRVTGILNDIHQYEFEILFVNDGSKDGTLALMKTLRAKDIRVSYLDLSRNFGKEIAMIAGIDHINSDAMIVMDADLQDPPELIPEMIYWWEKGYKDVCAKRKSRAGETWLKKWTSHMYYKVLQQVSSIPIQPDVGDFRLLDAQCINAIKLIRESQRYTKGIFSWIGFEKKEILFDRDARVAGVTKWNYFKLMNLAIEGLTSFTIVPLRIASLLGCVLSLVSILYMCLVIFKTLMWGDTVAGYPSLISVVLFIGGIQLLFLGIMGEYIGRIFNETKCRPLYFINEYNNTTVKK